MFELLIFLKNFRKIQSPPQYKEWVDALLRMCVHTRKQLPSSILLKQRPNEELDVHQYRLDNYREVTFGAMIKAFDRLFRIFNNLNFSIEVPDAIKNYVNETKFEQVDFDTYIQNIVVKYMLDDANGLLVWLPSGEALTDATQGVKPVPELVCCADIYYHDDDVLIYHKPVDIMKYKVPGKKAMDEAYKSYVVLTKTSYGMLFVYESDDIKDKYFELYKLEGFDSIPAILLGGIKICDYYESFFSPFLAFGDEAIARFSDWQAVNVRTAYPHIEELATDCEAPGCNDGQVKGEGGEMKDCSSCNGTGRKTYKGPFSTYLRKVPEDADANNYLDIPSRRYIHPDVDILKYLDETWKKLLEMGEDQLHLVYTKQAQSGVAKDIDREDGDSMIQKITNRVFDVLYFYSYKYMGFYLIGPSFKPTNEIKISKPTNYRVRTESDYLEEISTLKEKKAPAIFVFNASRELSQKRFSYDEVSKKIFDVIFEFDALSIYSVEELNTMLMANAITKEAFTKSIYFYQVLLKISEEMTPTAFVEAKNKDIFEKAQVMLKEYETKTPQILPNPGADAQI